MSKLLLSAGSIHSIRFLNTHRAQQTRRCSQQTTASGSQSKSDEKLLLTNLFINLSDLVVMIAVLTDSFRIHVTKLRKTNLLLCAVTAEYLTTRPIKANKIYIKCLAIITTINPQFGFFFSSRRFQAQNQGKFANFLLLNMLVTK